MRAVSATACRRRVLIRCPGSGAYVPQSSTTIGQSATRGSEVSPSWWSSWSPSQVGAAFTARGGRRLEPLFDRRGHTPASTGSKGEVICQPRAKWTRRGEVAPPWATRAYQSNLEGREKRGGNHHDPSSLRAREIKPSPAEAVASFTLLCSAVGILVTVQETSLLLRTA
jgi:hypothetical protein